MNNSKDLILVVTILSVFMFGSVAIMADSLGEEEKEADYYSETSNETTKEDIYRELYMSGCNESGYYYDYCKCTFDYMVDEVGADGVMESAQNTRPGEIPPLMEKAIQNCYSRINTELFKN